MHIISCNSKYLNNDSSLLQLLDILHKFFTTIPLTIILLVFAVPIVRVLLERGAFTANDTSLVAYIQGLYSLQIPFYVANVLMIRLITSMRLNHLIIWTCAINLLINILFNILLIKWIGIAGIALSTSLVYVVCFSVNFIFVTRKMSQIDRNHCRSKNIV